MLASTPRIVRSCISCCGDFTRKKIATKLFFMHSWYWQLGIPNGNKNEWCTYVHMVRLYLPMYLPMYVFTYVCIYLCMYLPMYDVCLYLPTYVWCIYLHMYGWVGGCLYECWYVHGSTSFYDRIHFSPMFERVAIKRFVNFLGNNSNEWRRCFWHLSQRTRSDAQTLSQSLLLLSSRQPPSSGISTTPKKKSRTNKLSMLPFVTNRENVFVC
jgi:hypothetical protein